MAYQQHEEEWNNGICSHCCGGSCSTCLASWFCSCFLYGRISSRLDNFPNTAPQDIEYWNGSCCIWYAAACVGFQWVPQMLRRQELRQRLSLRGDGCTDCLASYFCAPCSLAQMETELKDRAQKAQSASDMQRQQQQDTTGYYPVQQQQGMVYAQPGQQPPQSPPQQPFQSMNEKREQPQQV